MCQVEIGGLRVLYTGDYSCEEDRHLMAADTPREYPPDVLIVESTYGMQVRPFGSPPGPSSLLTPASPTTAQVHESREDRERKFLAAVEGIVRAGGRCLLPVFAVGRSQELLLILDEYWDAHPELQGVPIYHASKVANQSLGVYKTLISHMNARCVRWAGPGGCVLPLLPPAFELQRTSQGG